MKEQGKNPPDNKNEEETGSLPEKEFSKDHPKSWEQNGENTRKIYQRPRRTKEQKTMMNNTINAIKNPLEGINSRITEAEEWISDLEDKILEITTAEQNKEKNNEKN